VRPQDLPEWIADTAFVGDAALAAIFLACAQRMFAAGQSTQMTDALRTVHADLLLVDAGDLNALRRRLNLSLQLMLSDYPGAPDADAMFSLEGTKDKGPRYE
jgi:hypothetical protein